MSVPNENGVQKTDQKVDVEQIINLKVKSQDGAEVQFKVKQSTLLKKVFSAYCARVSQDPGMVMFLFDGERLRDLDTPMAKEMEDGDTIDVVIHQVGGHTFNL